MTADQGADDDEIGALQEEIRRLRLEIDRLQRANQELLRSLNDRDFERPPHY